MIQAIRRIACHPAVWPGRELRLLFTGALTVTDATSNIRLNGNFTTNNGAALYLVFDGTNWQEISRNPNT